QRVGLRRSADVVEGLQELLVPRHKTLFPSLILKEAPNRVVKPKGAPIEIEAEKEGKAIKLAQQILCLPFVQFGGLTPEPCNYPDRDVRILGEDRQLGESRTLFLVQQAEAQIDGAGHRFRSVAFVVGGESVQSLFRQAL